jgi:di/tricarboxylate transporter
VRKGEAALIAVLMAAAAILSALINTTTVAVILLPATMDLARRSGLPPARLLMPMAMGCLLGGPFTGISTPPNILATDALRNAGLTTFEIFDFTPITLAMVVAGIAFMVFLGKRLLPRRGAAGSQQERHRIGLRDRIAHLHDRAPADIAPGGPQPAESRLGSALYLTVVGLHRAGEVILSPRAQETLRAGDIIIVHGQSDQVSHFHGSRHLRVEPAGPETAEIMHRLGTAAVRIPNGSPLIGRTLAESGLRRDHRVHVLALSPRLGTASGISAATVRGRRRPRAPGRTRGLGSPGGEGTRRARGAAGGRSARSAGRRPAQPLFRAGAGRVGAGWAQPGGEPPGQRLRPDGGGAGAGRGVTCLPAPEETIQPGDLLVVQGLAHDIDVFEGLQDLKISEHSSRLAAELESQQIGMAEVLLSPRTTLAGKTLNDLLFRDHYGLSVLAVLRKGRACRKGLQDMALQFGDALLVYGPRQSLAAVARDEDFLVLDQEATQAPRLHKAPFAAVIMATVLLSAILGFVPIAIAGLTGVAAMVLSGCLTMEEAYRAIEWKVIFLIAGMLPLGVAIENTGAAQMGAQALIGMVGDLGPRWVVAVLFGVTVLGTQVVPTAALVVLMAPVALGAAASLEISPQLLMMTVAMAASASFASPLSHPAHLLVMGPGGYRFMDYVKVGAPLTLVVMGVSVWLLPILWPA